MRRKKKFWTKEEINTLLSLWEHKTVSEIAEELNRPNSAIIYMAGIIRRNGYKLPKKIRTNIIDLLVKEVLKGKRLIK
jgi:hypothetical protein